MQLRSHYEAAAQVEAVRHQAALEALWEELARSERRREETSAQLRAAQAQKAALEKNGAERDSVFGKVRALKEDIGGLRLQISAWKRSQTQELRVFASGLRVFSARAKALAHFHPPASEGPVQSKSALSAKAFRSRLVQLRASTSDLGTQAATELSAVFRALAAFRNLLFDKSAEATQLAHESEASRANRRLQLLYSAAQHELVELRERVTELTNEKSRLQKGLLAFVRDENSSEVTAQRMQRHLELENKGLVELNRKFAAQALELKEKVIRLEAGSQTPRLLKVVRQLEDDNRRLSAMTQRGSLELSPAKPSLPAGQRDSQIPVRMEASAVSGTAALRRFDLLLSALETRRPQGSRSQIFECLDERWQPRSAFAKQCLRGDYTLLHSRGLIVSVAERIHHRLGSLTVELELSLTNTQEKGQRLGPCRVECEANDFAARGVSAETLLLQPFEVRTLSAVFELGAGYALDPAPIALHLATPSQPIVLLLPIVLTKLIPPVAEDPAVYAVLPSLAVVAEAAVSLRHNIEEDDMQRLFPHLIWLDDCSFVVKVAWVLGTFYLRVTLECSTVRLSAFASGPAQHIGAYIECVRDVLDNL